MVSDMSKISMWWMSVGNTPDTINVMIGTNLADVRMSVINDRLYNCKW